jgi:hypothetical protein
MTKAASEAWAAAAQRGDFGAGRPLMRGKPPMPSGHQADADGHSWAFVGFQPGGGKPLLLCPCGAMRFGAMAAPVEPPAWLR